VETRRGSNRHSEPAGAPALGARDLDPA